VEVGPRDGLQNEHKVLSVEHKLELIDQLSRTGLSTIEAGSFVSPKWVPQMNNSDRILGALLGNHSGSQNNDITYQWLVPNRKGLDIFTSVCDTYKAPPISNSHSNMNDFRLPSNHEISIFLAATESFSKKNTNCTIAESLVRAKELASSVPCGTKIRAYISVTMGCPFEGPSTPSTTKTVVDMTQQLLDLGAYQVAISDTTGMGTPIQVRETLNALNKAGVNVSRNIALHMHDTFGQAVANVLEGLEMGVRTFDGAVAGLGGCPFSPGATGNVATEDLVYAMQTLGINTGVNLERISKVGKWVAELLGKGNDSRAGKATLAKLARR